MECPWFILLPVEDFKKRVKTHLYLKYFLNWFLLLYGISMMCVYRDYCVYHYKIIISPSGIYVEHARLTIISKKATLICLEWCESTDIYIYNMASDWFMFWPLKCVGVEDLMGSDIPMIWGTSYIYMSIDSHHSKQIKVALFEIIVRRACSTYIPDGLIIIFFLTINVFH